MEITEKMKKAFEHIDPDSIKYGALIPMAGLAMQLQIKELNRQQQLEKSYELMEAGLERYRDAVFKKQHPIRHFFRELFKKLKGRA